MPAPQVAIKRRPVRVTVMDEYAVVDAWLNEKAVSGEMKPGEAQERMRAYEANSKSWAGPIKDGYGDIRLIHKLAKDMKTLGGRVYFKTYKGAEYVIVRGRPAVRQIISGTRYKTIHPKMIEFQIGKAGLKSAARESFVFGAIFVTAVDIADYFMRDSATLGELVGNIGMDIAKVAVASAAGYAVGALVVGTVVGTFAIGPLVVAFGAAVIVGYALDKADEYFGITERLSKALDAAFEAIERFAREGEAEAEAWLKRIESSPTVVDLSRNAENWWNRTADWSSHIKWKYGMAGWSFYGI